jgi:hypothetical protein
VFSVPHHSEAYESLTAVSSANRIVAASRGLANLRRSAYSDEAIVNERRDDIVIVL